MSPAPLSPSPALLTDLRVLIDQARQAAAVAVNAGLTLLYWRIGQRIRTEVLGGARANYGATVVASLAQQLAADYGRGFEEKNLRRMVQFAEVFPDEQIVVSLIRQLSWTHFLVLLPLKDPLAREFYAQMCSLERWSVRTLRERVGSLLFERTAVSRQPEQFIRHELDAAAQGSDLSPPLGIILCTGKKQEQIELLELDKSGIHVAEYLTVLPPRAAFEQKIQSALQAARARLGEGGD